MDIYAFLHHHEIGFERYDHAPVFTCEQASELVQINGGIHTKNLFLRDKKGKRHFLLVVEDSTVVDLAALATLVGVPRLGMASRERLHDVLGIDPGSVSVLALINDGDARVEVLVDEAVWTADCVRCHPLVNTSTLLIQQDDLRRFLQMTGHDPTVLQVPAKR